MIGLVVNAGAQLLVLWAAYKNIQRTITLYEQLAMLAEATNAIAIAVNNNNKAALNQNRLG